MLGVEQEAAKRHIECLALDHWSVNGGAHAFFGSSNPTEVAWLSLHVDLLYMLIE